MIKVSLRDLVAKKILLREELHNKLGVSSVRRVNGDYHSRKPPRPCGMTVHSAIGCTCQCVYCYIEDMGFPRDKIVPYGLSGEEMTLALLLNPYFLPSRLGTYIALGSVGEPFHPSCVERTLEYIACFSKYLENLIQFSTKYPINREYLRKIAQLRGYPLSPLITIVTLKKHEVLEPRAPTPESRLETIRMLRKEGLYPILFFRPVIPGVNDEEADEIFNEAKQAGAVGVVIGGFRVSRNIINRMEKAGIDVSRIAKYASAGERFSEVPLGDTKLRLAEIAREKGITPLFAACCAGTLAAFLATGKRYPCAGVCFADTRFCSKCPVNCSSVEVHVEEGDVKWAVKRLSGDGSAKVDVGEKQIVIWSKKLKRLVKRKPGYILMLQTAYRKKLVVRH